MQEQAATAGEPAPANSFARWSVLRPPVAILATVLRHNLAQHLRAIADCKNARARRAMAEQLIAELGA